MAGVWLFWGFPQESLLPLTDPHHMVIKPFLLIGLAEYRSQRWMWSTLPPTIRYVYDTHRRTKLTAPETISRWLLLKKIALWATLSGFTGNVRTPSIARWKARGPLYYIRHKIELFHCLLRLRRYKRKSVEVCVSRSTPFEKRRLRIWAQISEGRERRPPTTVGVRVAAVSYTHLTLPTILRV